jgi:hypothetical protein
MPPRPIYGTLRRTDSGSRFIEGVIASEAPHIGEIVDFGGREFRVIKFDVDDVDSVGPEVMLKVYVAEVT